MRRFATTVLAITALLIGGLGLQPAAAAGYPPCTITGTAAGETITGTEGNDVICTGGGNDTVNALGGNDIIIVSGPGIDTINGGSGNDTIDAALGTDSTIDAGTGDDTVYGTSGDDDISAGDGADSVDSNEGDDTVVGGPGNDDIIGDIGDDTIYGSEGSDSLQGGQGNDRMSGGSGNDTAEGDAGANACVFDNNDVTVDCRSYKNVGLDSIKFVSGRLTGCDGKPIVGATVSVLESGNQGAIGNGVSGVDGRYVLSAPVGLYDFSVQYYAMADTQPKLSCGPGRWSFTQPSVLNVNSNSVMDFQLPKSQRVKVHVQDSAGLPVPDANLLELNGGGWFDTVLSINGAPAKVYFGDGIYYPDPWTATNANGDFYYDTYDLNAKMQVYYWYKDTYFQFAFDKNNQQAPAGAKIKVDSVDNQSTSSSLEPPKALSMSSIKTNSAVLSWSAVTSLSKVTNYKVEVSANGATWTPVSKKVSTSTSLSLSGLKLGTSYQVRVAATNSLGTGEFVYGSFKTLATVPSAPTALFSSSLSGSSFSLGWNAPSSNGGSDITDYVVEINGGGFNWAPVAHSPSNNTSISITGLNPGVKYSVRVKAINSVGASKVSSTLSVTTLTVLPSSPTLILKSKTATSVVLSWVAPANGGAKISDYKAEYSTDGGTSWLTVSKSASTSTSLTLKNLKTKTSYLFRVSAKNSVGYSAPSSNLIVVTQ